MELINKILKNIAKLYEDRRRMIVYYAVFPSSKKKLTWRQYKVVVYSLLFMLLLPTCKTLYRFVSSSLPKDVKYFHIEPITCNRPEIESYTLSQKVYSKLKNRLGTIFQQKKKGADIAFKVEITDYKLDTKTKEVSAKISITYTNYEGKEEKFDIVKHKKLLDNQKTVQDYILQEMAEEIIDDIWDKTVAKW